MNIIAWMVVGLIGGALAMVFRPGDDPGGIRQTIALGIAGALLGGSLSIALGIGNGVDDFDIGTTFLSIVGSILLLLGYRLIAMRA